MRRTSFARCHSAIDFLQESVAASLVLPRRSRKGVLGRKPTHLLTTSFNITRAKCICQNCQGGLSAGRPHLANSQLPVIPFSRSQLSVGHSWGYKVLFDNQFILSVLSAQSPRLGFSQKGDST